MPIPLNKTIAEIPASGIRRFFEIVAEKPDVISLSVGEPDFDPPWPVCEAAIHALEKSLTHYSGNRGTPELRQAISQYFKQRFGVHYNSATEILVTNGASEACDLAIRATINPGDEVLILTPTYVMYTPLIQLAGGIPVPISTLPNFQIPFAKLPKFLTKKTKALILNYPSNPTGKTLKLAELTKIATFAYQNNLLLISDEIYAELTYAGQHKMLASLPKISKQTLTISGLSKFLAMTGFRLGFLAGPEKLISAALKIHQYSAICANSISQAAALEALRNYQNPTKKMLTEYKNRRDFVWRELNKIGLKVLKPAGAFYFFIEVKKSTNLNGDEFSLQLLQQKKIAVVPGSAFSPDCQNFVRLSYATNLTELTLALQRIHAFILSLK